MNFVTFFNCRQRNIWRQLFSLNHDDGLEIKIFSAIFAPSQYENVVKNNLK